VVFSGKEDFAMLTRWEPWGEMLTRVNRLHDAMNRLFGEANGNGNRETRPAGNYPALAAWEDEGTLFVEAELPGMELSDLEILVTGGNKLSIRGERKPPHTDGTWHRQERGFGPFSRVVTLPYNVDPDQVEAKLQQGVLTLALPKAAEAKPRRITVKSS
jgi:HSP20 family protein